jgi:hypothetical protein
MTLLEPYGATTQLAALENTVETKTSKTANRLNCAER